MRLWIIFWLAMVATVDGIGQMPVFRTREVIERPARLTAEWKGARHPVVWFSSNRPVVLVDGKRRISDYKALGLSATDRYADGFVEMRNTDSKNWTLEQYIDGQKLSGTQAWSTFACELSADRDLRDVFIVLVVFEVGEAHGDDPPRVAILGVPVGDLKQGVKKKASAALPALNTQKRTGWAALVFSSEGQVRSSGPESMISVFFDRVERYNLRIAIRERVFAGEDAPLKLLRFLPIRLDDELLEKYQGQSAKVRLYVSIDGDVEAVHLEEPRDSRLQGALEPQLRRWLFIPPMKEGRLVRQQVVLPLDL
jgi:hypothetical protein